MLLDHPIVSHRGHRLLFVPTTNMPRVMEEIADTINGRKGLAGSGDLPGGYLNLPRLSKIGQLGLFD